METVQTHPPSQSSSDAATPLLLRRHRRRRVMGRGGPLPPLRHAAARFLRRPLARRMMLSSPSFLVRENAAEQLEHHRNEWSYSATVVVLDVALNLVLVGVSLYAVVLGGVGIDDDDDVELISVWVVGYGVGCMVHLACVAVECRERLRGRGRGRERSEEAGEDDSDEEDGGIQTSILKHVESANTIFSCVWWVVGAYWVTAASPDLMQDSPELYWICISFLAFDIIFVFLCIAITCLIGIAVCCFLPCIIAILYAMADQEGATQEEIEQLRKFKFRRIIIECEGVDGPIQTSSGGIMTKCDSSTPMEQTLTEEDAECCICLCAYEDGTELRQVPCGHYFHSGCIDKWLFINAICPLCKFNILKPGGQGGSIAARATYITSIQYWVDVHNMLIFHLFPLS